MPNNQLEHSANIMVLHEIIYKRQRLRCTQGVNTLCPFCKRDKSFQFYHKPFMFRFFFLFKRKKHTCFKQDLHEEDDSGWKSKC